MFFFPLEKSLCHEQAFYCILLYFRTSWLHLAKSIESVLPFFKTVWWTSIFSRRDNSVKYLPSHFLLWYDKEKFTAKSQKLFCVWKVSQEVIIKDGLGYNVGFRKCKKKLKQNENYEGKIPGFPYSKSVNYFPNILHSNSSMYTKERQWPAYQIIIKQSYKTVVSTIFKTAKNFSKLNQRKVCLNFWLNHDKRSKDDAKKTLPKTLWFTRINL